MFSNRCCISPTGGAFGTGHRATDSRDPAQETNLSVIMAEVRSVISHAKSEIGRGELSYDYLVIALGGHTVYFGHDEMGAICAGLKSLDDAVRLRRKILLAYERPRSNRSATPSE